MSQVIAVKITLSSLILWMACFSPLLAETLLRSQSNRHFEIIGLESRSVSYINELSVYSVQIAERYLLREGLAFPMPILISLRPEAHVDFEGDYRIRRAERGTVQLDLRWEPSLTLELTCQAISEALLRQYALYNYGAQTAEHLRAWPVAALSSEIYLGLRPAQLMQHLEQARAQTAPPLARMSGALLSDGTMNSMLGYWLLRAMKVGDFKQATVRRLFQQAVAGVDIKEALTAALQPSAPTAEPLTAQAWWTRRLDAILSRTYDVIDSMERSRAWLADLARFETPVKLDSGETRLNLRSLWKYRAEPEVRTLVQARYEILRLRMARTNPAYFNPARSLGVLFEQLLSDAPSHRYLHMLAIYLSDWEDAKKMQEQVDGILGEK